MPSNPSPCAALAAGSRPGQSTGLALGCWQKAGPATVCSPIKACNMHCKLCVTKLYYPQEWLLLI